MHILITANTSWGLINFRGGLIRTLLADGHKVTALAPPDESTSRLQETGCRFIPLEMDNKGTSPLRDGALLLKMWRVFRKERPDVLLSYTIKNNIYGALAARLVGIPVLPNVTGLGTVFIKETWLTTLVKLLYRLGFARAPVVFFLNREDMSLFVQQKLVAPGQAALLPGEGVDLEHFKPVDRGPDGGPVFLLVARMLWDKGVGIFVEAARRIRARHPDARFQLLGFLDVDNTTAVDRKTMDSWVAEGVVEYLGSSDDVRPFVAAADCIVLPSFREGLPRSLLEAVAMARPIIATDAPGCRDVVDDGRNGFLCQPRDVDSLADALERFIALPPEERRRLGLAGRARAERDFDEKIIIEAYRDKLSALQQR